MKSVKGLRGSNTSSTIIVKPLENTIKMSFGMLDHCRQDFTTLLRMILMTLKILTVIANDLNLQI